MLLFHTLRKEKSLGQACCSVRVRMAPSPTGKLHLGGLRTALFNYLFARKKHGTFILRIEDTDQSRYDSESEKNIYSSLDWCGITPDEMEEKGDFGPYKQSLRTEIYRDYAHQLLEKRHAYRCYCTEDKLTEMRRVQNAKGMTFQYDKRCRSLPINQAREKDSGKGFGEYEHLPYVVRLKVPDGETLVKDEVFGDIVYKNVMVDDQILLKSDGYPTYHLANVVDDHLMKVSHVIRGEEWLNSTPKHVILYDAFGWEHPKFYHLPLLLNPDRSKLSKRSKDISVGDYESAGYLPMAVINFVSLLGWAPSDGQELFFSMKDIYRAFSLKNVNKSPCVVDTQKLTYFNKMHMKHMLEKDAKGLAQLFVDAVRAKFPEAEPVVSEDKKVEYLVKVLQNVQDNFTTVGGTIDQYPYYFVPPDFSSAPKTRRALLTSLGLKPDIVATAVAASQDATRACFFASASEFIKKPNFRFSAEKIRQMSNKAFGHDVLGFKLLRFYLTGRPDGEELELILKVLPYSVITQRLSTAKSDFESRS